MTGLRLAQGRAPGAQCLRRPPATQVGVKDLGLAGIVGKAGLREKLARARNVSVVCPAPPIGTYVRATPSRMASAKTSAPARVALPVSMATSTCPSGTTASLSVSRPNQAIPRTPRKSRHNSHAPGDFLSIHPSQPPNNPRTRTAARRPERSCRCDSEFRSEGLRDFRKAKVTSNEGIRNHAPAGGDSR